MKCLIPGLQNLSSQAQKELEVSMSSSDEQANGLGQEGTTKALVCTSCEQQILAPTQQKCSMLFCMS